MKILPAVKARRAQEGVSLIELMIAIVLGMMILAALVSVFANSSRARTEMERTSRQIENGRFAMEVISDELRLAGFYGELDLKALGLPATIPDPCSTNKLDWANGMLFHVVGYDNGTGSPPCVPATRKPGTDVLVVRRVSSCEAGVGGCGAQVAGLPYLQVSKCQTEIPTTPWILDKSGSTPYTLTTIKCLPGTPAGVRRYLVNIFFISTDNGSGQAIPTLKMLSFDGTSFTEIPLVEGIEELNIEYGMNFIVPGPGQPLDGTIDAYSADPTTWTSPSCPGCTAAKNWSNVMVARISLLARNIEATPNYVDSKTYSLGYDAAGAEITVTPGDAYHRHVYTSLVRIVNAAERRDVP